MFDVMVDAPYTLFQNGGKILLYFVHADEAKRANLHGYIKKIVKWLPFWIKVYDACPLNKTACKISYNNLYIRFGI